MCAIFRGNENVAKLIVLRRLTSSFYYQIYLGKDQDGFEERFINEDIGVVQ